MTGGLLVLVLVVAISGIALASTTKVPVWQSGGSNLPYGSAVTVGGESSGFSMRWGAAGGHEYEMNCRDLTTNATAENFAYRRPGTVSGSSYTFHSCALTEDGIYYTICVLSVNPTFSAHEAVLSDSELTSGALRINEGEIKVSAAGCSSLSGSWTAKFSGRMAPSPNQGEYVLPAGTPTTVASFSGEIEYMGVTLKNGTNPLVISQQEVSQAPFLGRHWSKGGTGRVRGEGAPQEVAAGSALELFKGSTAINIQTTVAGAPVTISCNGVGTLAGKVEDPAGGGPGTATLGLGFGGCGVNSPGCTVEGGGFATNPLSGTVSNSSEGTQPALLQLKPASGTTLAVFRVVGTGCSINGITLTLSGSLYVSPQLNAGAQAGSWTIPTAINVEKGSLKSNGKATTPSGEFTAEAANGELVTMG